MNRILILGASGFIGNWLYKELSGYFDLHGTYCTPTDFYKENQVMHYFDVTHGNLGTLLNTLKPTVVISSLRGDFEAQLQAHNDLIAYSAITNCMVYYLSTVNVFDAKKQFVSYEYDTPMAATDYGRFKLTVEKSLQTLPAKNLGILRLPLVVGVNAPRIVQLKQAHKNKAAFEVYPNLIISATTASRVAQQVHYMVNQRLSGVYHLASQDLMHHNDFFNEIAHKLGLSQIIFKQNYESNTDQYLAILPKENTLPKQFSFKLSELINEITLKEEIVTLKENLLP